MIKTKQSSGLLGVLLPMFFMLMFSGCATHIEKGWGHFSKDKFTEARAEWAQSKTPALTQKADAGRLMVARHNEAEAFAASGKMVNSTQARIDLLALDKWPKEKWIDKSPKLKAIVLTAKTQVESERVRVQAAYDKEQECGDTQYQAEKVVEARQCYRAAVQVTKIYNGIGLKTAPQVQLNLIQIENEINRIQTAYNEKRKCGDTHYQAEEFAEAEQCYGAAVQISRANKRFGLKTTPQVQYNLAISCGKTRFERDEYEDAKVCFKLASKIGEKNTKRIKAEDTESMLAAVGQAVEIARQMEEERVRALARQRREEEQQRQMIAEQMRFAEMQRKLFEKQQKIEEARAKAAEIARLKAEKERQRKEALRKKRWQDFLAKGKPLKPLVAVVGIPSKGKGRLSKKNAKQKFQGSAQFPLLKKKKLRVQDLYALEIVVPGSYKLTYLRNYHKKKGSMLKIPQNLGGKKHYYTEGYKGGRFYTEVQNVKGKQSKYKVKAVIYKIPVVH